MRLFALAGAVSCGLTAAHLSLYRMLFISETAEQFSLVVVAIYLPSIKRSVSIKSKKFMIPQLLRT